MIKASLLFLILVSNTFSGLQLVDFLNTKIKKERIRINTFNNTAVREYFKNDFIQGFVHASDHIRFANNREGVFLISSVTGKLFHANSNTNIYSYYNNKKTDDKKFEFLSSVSVSPTGEMYLVDDATNQYIHASLDINNGYKLKSTFQEVMAFPKDLHQVVWASGESENLVFLLGRYGQLLVLNENEDEVARHTIINTSPVYRKLKSDHVIQGGKVIVYTLTKDKGTFIILEIKFDIATNSFTESRIVLDIVNATELIDFVPFYIDANNLHFFALTAAQNIFEFDESGNYLSTVIEGYSGGVAQNPQPVQEALTLSSCNSRNTVKNCRNVIVAENFKNPGRGLKRFEYVPDGFSYYHPLQIQIKDVGFHENNISKPKVIIRNESQIKILHDFSIKFWFSKEEYPAGQLVYNTYYSYPSGHVFSVESHPSNANIVAVKVAFPEGFEVMPNEETNEEELQFGVHLLNYFPGSWDKTNDWSWASVSDAFTVTENVTVYDNNGDLIYGNEPNPLSVVPPPSTSVGEILGFEVLSDWNVSDGGISSETVILTQGSGSINITGGGYQEIFSRPFNTDDIKNTTNDFVVDLYIGGNQPNPNWVGQLQLYIDAPSKNILNQYIGQMELTGLPNDVFSSINYLLPKNIIDSFNGSCNDMTIKFVLNTNPISGPYYLDNIHF